jgi:hypothetical protein
MQAVETGLVSARSTDTLRGDFAVRAEKCKGILVQVDKLLDQIEKYDPYGDMIENFADPDADSKRDRVTTRLIGQINGDLGRK